MNLDPLSRRQWLTRGLTAAAAIGVTGGALDVLGATLKPQLDDITPSVCTLTCAQTLGPCYYSGTQVRHDITEGKSGLPSLLGFLIVDADTCQPVENASIDIWHTDRNGVYSAPITAMCNAGDATARTQTFCRGVQPADANGWAYFRTIYPGWYSGRTTHIHATIRVGTSAIVTSQFHFADTLIDYIYRTHPLYTHRPAKDTTNVRDGVIGGAATRVDPFLIQGKLIRDESLVGLKVIAIRNSTTRCSA